jgi:hypothetical protein
MKECVWTRMPEEKYWDTGCGQGFYLIDGTLEENRFKFCAYCGGKIVDRVIQDEDGE